MEQNTVNITMRAEEVALLDESLVPSLPPRNLNPNEHRVRPLKSTLKIQVNKLDLKIDQSITVTKDFLSWLPTSQCGCPKSSMEDESEDVHGDGSNSTILYSWPDEMALKVKQTLLNYKKPKFKVCRYSYF